MSEFNEELYAEIQQDNGIQYDESIDSEMFDYMFFENIEE